jgi:hypothetical protein
VRGNTSDLLEFASRLQIEEMITALSLGAEQRLSAIIQKLRRLLGRFEC